MKMVKSVVGMLGAIVMLVSLPHSEAMAQETLVWPVPGHYDLSRDFDSHEGKAIDISDGDIDGADIVAALDGTVTNVWYCTDNHYLNEGDCYGFGTGVVILGSDGRYYQYAHMKGDSIPQDVYEGAYVAAGQKIGEVGSTGNSSGSHLHFAITMDSFYSNNCINPEDENYAYTSIATWGNLDCQPKDDDTYVYIEVDMNMVGKFTEAGINIWDESGQLVGSKNEIPAISQGDHLNIFYNVKEELGITLESGHSYTYQFYVVFEDTRFDSEVYSFTTTGLRKEIVDQWINSFRDHLQKIFGGR